MFLALAAGAGTNDLSVAREALRDGLWKVARTHALPVGSDEAKLVVLESYAGEGKWDEIGRCLSEWKDAKGDGFDYYRALLKGDHATAMSILKSGGSPEGLVEAKMFEADALAKGGNRVAANALWREVVQATNVGERVYAVACANLMDAELLRKAVAEVKSVPRRRMLGLRLGMSLLREAKTAVEGEKTIRAIVKDSPDAEGAREAFLAVADAHLAAERWKVASEVCREAIEIWPDVAKLSSVQESIGWALMNMGRREEALAAFRSAGGLAKNDESHATAMLKEGDVLQLMGRSDEAMARYREVLKRYGSTAVARDLQSVIQVRERESQGRAFFRERKFAEAMREFAEVAKADTSRASRMDFFSVLCLYGQGRDDEAAQKARWLAAESPDPAVRVESSLWLAKFLYNRREWKESKKLFLAYSEAQVPEESAAEALLWAARAALADNDMVQAIQLSTQAVERYPESKLRPQTLLVQGEALVDQARFDEAVFVLDRVAASDGAPSEVRVRARLLKVDALYAMGADDSSRYHAALETCRAIQFDGILSESEQIVVAFRIARVLEKLRKTDEAIDQYYTKVVIAYRTGRIAGKRYSDEARAAFSRAAFWLVDEYERTGRNRQAFGILELVAESDVPAATEAAKRLRQRSNEGGGR